MVRAASTSRVPKVRPSRSTSASPTETSAAAIASIPEHIRGYGHVKAKSIAAARAKRETLLAGYLPLPARAAA